jgi:hypothetical protein
VQGRGTHRPCITTDSSAVVATDAITRELFGKLQAQAIAPLQPQLVSKAGKGANSDITSLTGLITALSVAQGGTGVTSIAALFTALQTVGAYGKTNAVGTVGQTAGVPTGALMESGSNANGAYWRFANGLQICIGSLISGGTATTQGSIFVSTPASGSFPIAFVAAPVVVASGLYNASGTGWATQATFSSATTWGSWAVCYGASNGSASTISLIAVGRWF